jgi:predicted phage terminase large subunit-like protein
MKRDKTEARLNKWRQDCHKSLIEFGHATYPDYQSPRHIRALSNELQSIEQGNCRRMMINMPPRHGKTLTTSVLFAAWFIGKNPKKYVIFASASADLATSLGGQVRDLINSEIYQSIFPNVKLKDDTQSKTKFHTIQSGQVRFATVGERINGAGAHLFLIDDPIGNAQDADSIKYKKELRTWYKETARTRLMPRGAMVIINTRYRYDDLTGWLLDPKEHTKISNWRIINYPAFAEETGIDWRRPGEALCPEWFPVEELEETRHEIGSREFNALYQQKPSPDTGNIWQKSHIIEVSIDDIQPTAPKILFLDTAFGEKQTNDYSAGVMLCPTRDQKICVLDSIHRRLDFPKLILWTKEIIQLHDIEAVYIENKVSGISLIQTLRKEIDIPVVPINVERDKISRTNAVMPYFEAGKIVFKKPVNEDLVHEMLTFPYGAFDDLADALVGGVTVLTQHKHCNTNKHKSFVPANWFGR